MSTKKLSKKAVEGVIKDIESVLRRQTLELDLLEAEVAAKKAEIAELKDQQRRLSADRGFVEKLARRNRRVYPGELVFIFDD